jgi:hypothetical protein
MYAAEQGRENVIKLLIDCGSDRSAVAKVKTRSVPLQDPVNVFLCGAGREDGRGYCEGRLYQDSTEHSR